MIGDIRDYRTVRRVLSDADVVFNAAALKQVPSCEYFPWEASRTNIEGPVNIAAAIARADLPVETVVGISTDKACKPVNVMGMTKAIQERVFIDANFTVPRLGSCRPLRQRAGLAGLGRPAVPRSDCGRRPGHAHDAGT